MTERRREKSRSYAGFDPAREEAAKLFAAILADDHIAQGFRNRDISIALTEKSDDGGRLSVAVGRMLKRLQVRGLIVKVPRTRRWRVSEEGRRILGATLRVYRRYGTQAA